MRLVTVADFEAFILAEAPVKSVNITTERGVYGVTIWVRLNRRVLRRRRAVKRLERLLWPELPPGLLLRVVSW